MQLTHNFPSVGIGILNWNGKKWLEQFLPFLYNISYPNYTLYVIDNESTDDSLDFLRTHHPEVKIISTGGNYGVAGGYNRGFAQMPEEYLLMLNSDVEVTPGFLEPLVALMEADRQIAVCQSKLLSFQHKNDFEYGGAAGGMIDMLGYSFCRGRIFDTVESDNGQYQTADIFWAGGACCLIRKEAYHRVGGMYEYFFMHFEEIDLCWRMHALNYRLVYCNESVAYHVGGGTLSYQSPLKTYYNFRNNLIMVVKNSGVLFVMLWLPVRAGLDMLAMVKYLLGKDAANAAAILRGYWGMFVWLFKSVDKAHVAKKSLWHIPVVLKNSVIWLYFFRGKKKYLSIAKSSK